MLVRKFERECERVKEGMIGFLWAWITPEPIDPEQMPNIYRVNDVPCR